ncbi:MAG: hypothetical protein KGN02_13085 [bacterium]|nr:hypothetical protein [bacterium]
MLRRIVLLAISLAASCGAVAWAQPVTWTCQEHLTGCMGIGVSGEKEIDRARCLQMNAAADRPALQRTATFVVDAEAGTYVDAFGESGHLVRQPGMPFEYVISSEHEIVQLDSRFKLVDDRPFVNNVGDAAQYGIYQGRCSAQRSS